MSRNAEGCDAAARCWATTTAASRSAGSPCSRIRSASSPPHDVPIATTSRPVTGLFDPPVELLLSIELVVAGLELGEADRLLVTEAQDPEPCKALVEQAMDVVLEGPVEVDHHVAAEDDVELLERAVLDEVVLGPDDVLRQRPVEERPGVPGEVVLGERAPAAGADVVLRVLAHLVEREDTVAGLVEHDLVDVGRVDPRPVEQLLLGEEDRERVHLLARRAAGDPDAGERVRAEQRGSLLAESE